MMKAAWTSFHKDGIIRLLFKNAGVLLLGNIGAAIIGFASLALTARALGTEGLGTLVLITTYVLVVDKLINFQSWQVIIKYASEALKSNRKDDFKSILKFGYILDISAAIVGAIVAALVACIFGQWQDWKPDAIIMAAFYSATILSHISGPPTAVLRLFDRFILFSIITFSASLIKLVGVIVITVTTPDLWMFILLWAITDIIGNVLLIIFSVCELKKQGYGHIHQASTKKMAARFPGIWSFVITTNLNGSIRLASKEADVFFIGALLSPAAVGVYKVAKQIANILAMLIDPLYQTIYPALAKLNAAADSKGIVKMATGAAAVASFVSILVFSLIAAISEPLLLHVFGLEFIAAKPVMLWYAFAVVLAVASFPISPIIVAKGHPMGLLLTLLISTALYFSVLPWFIAKHGVVGAGMAYVAFYVSWVMLSLAFVIHLFWSGSKGGR
jgi:O-antigen/teichoic acid export membrane protein